MKNNKIKYFFLGIMIAFSISVIIISAVMTIASDSGMVPVSLIWQALLLSALCSLINLVYQSEKIKFVWQSIIAYVFTTVTIMSCSMIFDWYPFDGLRTVLISFLLYSICYLITWIIIWKVTKAKEKELNKKLMEYKQKNSVE